jgi:hypothetical protein
VICHSQKCKDTARKRQVLRAWEECRVLAGTRAQLYAAVKAMCELNLQAGTC